MDFIGKQTAIKNYIKNNLPNVLSEAELTDFDEYIDDYFDLDLYQKQKQLFFDFGNYTYEKLSNMSDSETLEFSVYLAFQNENEKVSKELMLKYAGAFYEMFTRSGRNFEGIADIGTITEATFYNAAEGNTDVKVAEITIVLSTEI